jgi:hypothetical protein
MDISAQQTCYPQVVAHEKTNLILAEESLDADSAAE